VLIAEIDLPTLDLLEESAGDDVLIIVSRTIPAEKAVTVEAILTTLRQNVTLAKRLLRTAMRAVADVKACSCQRALQDAIITAPDRMPTSLRRKLALLMDRVVPVKKGFR